MSEPRISIVVPSYGQAAFLEETLLSIFSQDVAELEVVVVDGGSDDGSADVIRRYEDRIAWWVSEPDQGQADALNKGFSHCTGDILGWVCSDDTLLPGALRAASEALVRDPEALLVYGDAELVDEAGLSLGLLHARPFDVVTMVRTCQNHVVQPGSLFRREALEIAGPFVVESHYYFDFEFVLKLGLAGRALQLNRSLGTYRLHETSKSTSGTLIKATDHERLFNVLFARPDLTPELRAVEREARSRSFLTAGEYYFAASKIREARIAYLRGVRKYPRHFTPRVAGLIARTLVPRSVLRGLRRVKRRAVTG